ncbi:hypothetical protein OIU35_17990 [Boseaceae bacterium BT-24-1]|nr:hypothetical protein [Boseaceae bacterium BT-24-1]
MSGRQYELNGFTRLTFEFSIDKLEHEPTRMEFGISATGAPTTCERWLSLFEHWCELRDLRPEVLPGSLNNDTATTRVVMTLEVATIGEMMGSEWKRCLEDEFGYSFAEYAAQ